MLIGIRYESRCVVNETVDMWGAGPGMKILVAEDEKSLQKIIGLYLEREGYEVRYAGNGQEAMELLSGEHFDLAVLDWMMPKMNGLSVCREIRSYKIPVKIIMLTAKGEAQSEITGLTSGADDYIKKPFEPRILLLRIKKLFHIEGELRCGCVSLNQETMTVKKDGEELMLPKKEYELLRVLLLNKGMVLSRDRLLDLVWGMEYEGDERTVDTHIRRLRSKIGQNMIRTHVGLGYSMEELDE